MPAKKNPNQEQTQLSIGSSEREQTALLDQISKLQQQLSDESQKRIAAESALGAKLGAKNGEMDALPDVAWGLAWLEYFHRKKMFQMVSPEGRRAKSDRYGNRWSLQPLPVIEGLSDEQYELFVQVAQELGYDPLNPPKNEYFMLHCFPAAGSYDLACDEIEKSSAQHISLQRSLIQAEKNLSELELRGPRDRIPNAQSRCKDIEEAIEDARQKFMECKAVIEHAVQRFYLIPMDSFEMMDHYGVPIKCASATVIPQKRHQNLPNYVPTEKEIAPQVG